MSLGAKGLISLRYCPRYVKGHTCTNSAHSYAIINTSVNAGIDGVQRDISQVSVTVAHWLIPQKEQVAVTDLAGWKSEKGEWSGWLMSQYAARLAFLLKRQWLNLQSTAAFTMMAVDEIILIQGHSVTRVSSNDLIFITVCCGVLWQLIVTATLLSASTVHCRAAMWVWAKEDS